MYGEPPTFIKGGQTPHPVVLQLINNMLKIVCSSAFSSHIKHGEKAPRIVTMHVCFVSPKKPPCSTIAPAGPTSAGP
jgi:hypothetical protein